MKWKYYQMTSQRHDFYDPNAIHNEYLEKLGMRYPQDKVCDLYKRRALQTNARKPKLEKKLENNKGN